MDRLGPSRRHHQCRRGAVFRPLRPDLSPAVQHPLGCRLGGGPFARPGGVDGLRRGHPLPQRRAGGAAVPNPPGPHQLCRALPRPLPDPDRGPGDGGGRRVGPEALCPGAGNPVSAQGPVQPPGVLPGADGGRLPDPLCPALPGRPVCGNLGAPLPARVFYQDGVACYLLLQIGEYDQLHVRAADQALLDQWQAAGVEIIQGFPTTDGSAAGEKGDHTT